MPGDLVGYFFIYLILRKITLSCLSQDFKHIKAKTCGTRNSGVFFNFFIFFMIAGILVGQLLFILNLKKSHPIDTADQSVKIR